MAHTVSHTNLKNRLGVSTNYKGPRVHDARLCSHSTSTDALEGRRASTRDLATGQRKGRRRRIPRLTRSTTGLQNDMPTAIMSTKFHRGTNSINKRQDANNAFPTLPLLPRHPANNSRPRDPNQK